MLIIILPYYIVLFYFLKTYLVPKVVIRDEPGITISKKGKARLPCYCYLSVTGETAGAMTEEC